MRSAWVAEARWLYYQRRARVDELVQRIALTDAGREFLRRTGAYGQRARLEGWRFSGPVRPWLCAPAYGGDTRATRPLQRFDAAEPRFTAPWRAGERREGERRRWLRLFSSGRRREDYRTS